MALLKSLRMRVDSRYIFPAPRRNTLSDMSLGSVMRRIHGDEVATGREGFLDSTSGRPAVPHGLRSTFRDWDGELTGYPKDMAAKVVHLDTSG
jgi:hypothetical protein